jgi:hypothetical protein
MLCWIAQFITLPQGSSSDAEQHAALYLATGQLVRVLEDWCPAVCGLFSLPSQPAATTTGALGTDRYASRRRQ